MRPCSKSSDNTRARAGSTATLRRRRRSPWLLISPFAFSVALLVPVTAVELVYPLDLVQDVEAVAKCRLEDIPSAHVEFPAYHCEDARSPAEEPSPIKFLSFDVVPFYKLDDNEYCQSYLNITWSVEFIHTSLDKSSSPINSSFETNEDPTSQEEYSSDEMNEDPTSQGDEETSSEKDEESSANNTASIDRANELMHQANQLSFKLFILPHALNGANLCAVISLSPADIVNRSVSFNCLRLNEGSYGFSLYVDRTLDDNTIEYMDVKDQDNVVISVINSCELPKIPIPSTVVTSPLPTPSLIVTDGIKSYNSVIVGVSVAAFMLTLIIVGIVVYKLCRKWNKRTSPRTPTGESRSLVSDSSLDSVRVKKQCNMCNSVDDSGGIVPPSC